MCELRRQGRQHNVVGSRTAGTSDEEDRSLSQDGMSAIGVNCRMYCGASPWRARSLNDKAWKCTRGNELAACMAAWGPAIVFVG